MVGSVDMFSLPKGVQSRMVENGNGLAVHYLEAGNPDSPLVLLLHGFPELAYSWRRLILPVAELGFHVVAPDQRGYGRTSGHSSGYDVDLAEFGMVNLAADVVGLVHALGHKQAALLAGHDFGSPVAAWSALLHPQVFQYVILMSAPFAGRPIAQSATTSTAATAADIHSDLANLSPPRKHYQWYFGDRDAEANMLNAPGGFKNFLRAYFHCKSADWPGNQPYKLAEWAADELAQMPRYYIMDLADGMAETALSMAPSEEEAKECQWLDEAELAIYTEEFERTGLQGGLNWYRRATSDEERSALAAFAGRKIQAPLAFIGGAKDWGVYQAPGALEAMEAQASVDYRGTHLIEGAGHWVQQEQPEAVLDVIRSALVAR